MRVVVRRYFPSSTMGGDAHKPSCNTLLLHGRRRGWTVAPGAGPAKGRAKRAEQGHHRRAEDHLSTENYVKFVVLFNIADGFPCFHG